MKNYCRRVKFHPHVKIKWRKPAGFGVTHNWTHMAMFWELPYWETFQLRHCLDVIYTEKNVFDNLFYTILNDDGKTKDNKKFRKIVSILKYEVSYGFFQMVQCLKHHMASQKTKLINYVDV